MHAIVRKLAASTTMLALAACTQLVGDDGATEPDALDEQIVDADQEVHQEGRIEPQKIQGAIRTQYLTDAKNCYEAELANDSEAAGKVLLRFSIVEGAATNVVVEPTEGNLDGDDFKTCMADALTEVSFPSVSGKVTVTYPIVFADE